VGSKKVAAATMRMAALTKSARLRAMTVSHEEKEMASLLVIRWWVGGSYAGEGKGRGGLVGEVVRERVDGVVCA
jgi:hypothetical protein